MFCGVDIGTSNLKVALVDADCQLRWLASQPTPRVPDGEGLATNAKALCQTIEALIIKAWRETGAGPAITAISTTGVGEDGLNADAEFNPLGPALAWFDGRAGEEAAELSVQLGQRQIPAGIGVDASRTAAKWLWLSRHRPAEAALGHAWLALTDYPLARWARQAFISETLAARTACLDVSTRQIGRAHV